LTGRSERIRSGKFRT